MCVCVCSRHTLQGERDGIIHIGLGAWLITPLIPNSRILLWNQWKCGNTASQGIGASRESNHSAQLSSDQKDWPRRTAEDNTLAQRGAYRKTQRVRVGNANKSPGKASSNDKNFQTTNHKILRCLGQNEVQPLWLIFICNQTTATENVSLASLVFYTFYRYQ